MNQPRWATAKLSAQFYVGQDPFLLAEEWRPRAQQLEHWKTASTLLSKRTFTNAEGQIIVEADWSPFVRRLRHTLAVDRRAQEKGTVEGLNSALKQYRTAPVRIPIIASWRHRNALDEVRYQYAVQSYLYDVFLIMNLAAPGSCSLDSTIIRASGKSPITFSLPRYSFERLYLTDAEDVWPRVGWIPLDAVCGWFFSVRDGHSQVPRNDMEKVLFGLLHVVTNGISPAAIVWLFNSLERLFDAKPGVNFSQLRDRISNLLSLHGNGAAAFRKNLSTMYGLRSAFVHGGLDVIHPMHSDWLDGEVLEQYGRLADSCTFGLSVLLASLQTVIENGWTSLKYQDTLVTTAFD